MSEFQIGDLVRVVRKIVKMDPEVWDNCWTNSMDTFVNNGEVYVVRRVDSSGVFLEEWGWHPDSLELVEKAAPTRSRRRS